MTFPLVEIATIGVVVPARNEELRLPRCLAAIAAAGRALRSKDADAPRLRVVVVADSCTDRTREIADQWTGVEVVVSDAGRVGAARATGIGHLLETEHSAGTVERRVWIACTDADSAVPVEWLQLQLHQARAGIELALGTVAPDPQELAAGILDAWRLRHLVTDGHPYVHGANLGIRGDTYRAAGGFQDVAAHEDVLLSVAVRSAGARVISSAAGPVLTSGRSRGRAPLGMATYLRELAGDQLPLQA